MPVHVSVTASVRSLIERLSRDVSRIEHSRDDSQWYRTNVPESGLLIPSLEVRLRQTRYLNLRQSTRDMMSTLSNMLQNATPYVRSQKITGVAENLELNYIETALRRFPGKIKILGAINGKGDMGFCISKESPQLLASFNEFLSELKARGKLSELIQTNYPGIEKHFPEVIIGRESDSGYGH
jgi:hypothetical protein